MVTDTMWVGDMVTDTMFGIIIVRKVGRLKFLEDIVSVTISREDIVSVTISKGLCFFTTIFLFLLLMRFFCRGLFCRLRTMRHTMRC
jgi:hypothetical protein